MCCVESSGAASAWARPLLLTKLASSAQFPVAAREGAEVLRAVEAIEADAKQGRGDLQTMARSLAAVLRRQARDWVDDKGAKLPARPPLPPPPAASKSPAPPPSAPVPAPVPAPMPVPVPVPPPQQQAPPPPPAKPKPGPP